MILRGLCAASLLVVLACGGDSPSERPAGDAPGPGEATEQEPLDEARARRLLDDFGGEDEGARRRAFERLRDLSPDDAVLAEVFVDGLREQSVMIRIASATALLRLGTANGLSVRELLRHLDDGEHGDLARDGLLNAGLDAVPYLLEELTRESWSRRKAVAEALARMGDPAVERVVRRLSEEDGRSERLEVLLAVEPGLLPDAGALLPALRDRRQTVRWKAIRVIGRMEHGGAEAVPVLAEALGDDWDLVRRDAASVLAKFGTAAAPAVPSLLAVLTDPEADVRRAAMKALGAAGETSPEVVDALAGALTDEPGPSMRIEAARALGRLGPAAESARSGLSKAYEDPDSAVRMEAAFAMLACAGDPGRAFEVIRETLALLGAHNRERAYRRLAKVPGCERLTLDLLIEGLGEKNPEFRNAALSGIRERGPAAASATPHLIAMLEDGGWGFIVHTLAGIGEAAVPALEEALAETKPAVRPYVALALWRIRKDAAQVMGAVLGALESDDPEIRQAGLSAVRGMGEGARAAVPRLISLLEQRVETYWVLAALERMGAHAEPALDAMIACLGDDDLGLRGNAARALGELGPVAARALPALERVRAADPEGLVGLDAESAIEVIRGERDR